jgi:hypothetical protein
MLGEHGKSEYKNKRFYIDVTIKGKVHRFHYGDPNGYTYIDGADDKTRENYWKRHWASPNEREYISNLIPSPALMSAMLLWGRSHDFYENYDELNKLLKKKYNVK